MLELRASDLLDTSVRTVSGETLDACLDWWQDSERRTQLARSAREQLERQMEGDRVSLERRAAAQGWHSIPPEEVEREPA